MPKLVLQSDKTLKCEKAVKLCTLNKYDLAPVKFQQACVVLVGNMLNQQGWVVSLLITHNKNNKEKIKLHGHYESCTSKNWHTEPDNLKDKTGFDQTHYWKTQIKCSGLNIKESSRPKLEPSAAFMPSIQVAPMTAYSTEPVRDQFCIMTTLKRVREHQCCLSIHTYSLYCKALLRDHVRTWSFQKNTGKLILASLRSLR